MPNDLSMEENGMMERSVAICVPCYREIDPECVGSLVSLVYNARPLPAVYAETRYMFVADARNSLTKKLCDMEALPPLLGPYDPANVTHVLWADSDMGFPPDAVRRLLRHDVDSVSGVCFRKEHPYEMTVYRFNDRGSMNPLQEMKTGLTVEDATGAACLLLSLSLLRRMRGHFGDEHWFRHVPGVCGEDTWFFRRLKKMGVPHHVDWSLKTGHLATDMIGENHWQLTHETPNESPFESSPAEPSAGAPLVLSPADG